MNSRQLWRQWVVANVLGELLGLGTVAVAGFTLVVHGGQPTGGLAVVGFAGLMILLGAFEGAVLGVAQWLVLQQVVPQLAWHTWVRATLIGAVVAWTLGMVPSTILHLGGGPNPSTAPALSPLVVLSLATVMGGVLGVVLAMPQWLVLRRGLRHAAWWLVANLCAWAGGMPIIFAVAGAVPAGVAFADLVTIVLATIAGVGGVVGAVHGVALVLVVRANARAQDSP